MKFAKHLLLFSLVFLGLSIGLALSLAKSASADDPPDDPPSPSSLAYSDRQTGEVTGQADETPPPIPQPLISPAAGATVITFKPTFEWQEVIDTESGVVSYTLVMTDSLGGTTSITTTTSVYTPTDFLSNGVYTWTVQAHDAAGNSSDYVTPPYTFTIQVEWLVYLPIVMKPEPLVCPVSSTATFELIPIDGQPADHPDYLHGDLNLSLRGYELTTGSLNLSNIDGGDSDPPHLAGLFAPNRFPGISAVYRVYDWNWGCGTHGCRGPIITDKPVTLIQLITTQGEPISIPERGSNIFTGNYKAMVLYAEEQRITLGYTRLDTVGYGYSVHLENICVDPNLLALYRAQVNAEGWHSTRLPALRNNQAFGTALDNQLRVAIRDQGTFMDPRTKDWWRGY